MVMDFESNYDIAASAQFIHTHNFSRVALQVRPSFSLTLQCLNKTLAIKVIVFINTPISPV